MKHLSILLSLLLSSSCAYQDQEAKNALTQEEKDNISAEIIEVVDNYIKAVTSNNQEKTLAFWSDSEEFIHAGDGIVIGGYEEWASWLNDWYDPNRKWLYWDTSNVNTVVLSRGAVVYTYNFADAYVDQTDTTHVEGCWTYIFRKENNDWKVIASNGTHKGLTY